MSHRIRTCGVIALCLLVPPSATWAPAGEEPLSGVSIKTDRKRYDPDDTMLFAVTFKQLGRTKIQLSPYGNGSGHFYLILQSLDRTDKDGKHPVNCWPAWELQFVEKSFFEQEPKSQLIAVKSVFTHQVVIHLPQLRRLPEEKYSVRIGYALHGETLAPLIKSATGQDLVIGSVGGEILDGAFEEPLLSDAVEITIGKAK